jgi:hypothetical protein
MTDPSKAIPDLSLEDLSRMYLDGETCDKSVFAEQRTNLQLVAGQHYVREGSKFYNRIRSNKQLSNETRLKLTKNHTQRVTKIYRNSIESFAPGVQILAANEKELADQKQAEMNSAYWEYMAECNDFNSLRARMIGNFVEIGEVCAKVFWDMDGGQVVGYNAMMEPHPETGEHQYVTDEYGSPQHDENSPVFSGKLKIEAFEAYNLRRDPAARSMMESPYLTYSKLVPVATLRTMLDDKDSKELMDSQPLNEYTVFDNNTGTYRTVRDQVLVKETYFRPCAKIPKGYYFIWIDKHIISKGELPYGIFPIIHEGFDDQTGNARSHSIIRHIRPAQIEINRCASAISTHQVTLGDDKVWVQSTTKVSQGALLPGIRVNSYSGAPPTFQPGRSGDQYLAYLENQIDELYRLANLEEILEDKPDSPDLYANLLRSFRFKKKFAIYGEKFERFLIRLVRTALQLAKNCANEAELVPALGRSEYINIEEFKKTEDIHYQIKIKPRTDDIESQFGKQITLNHMIQYVGPQLDKEDLGQMIRLSPFLNTEQAFEKFTQKYDNIVNDILALDRGKYRPPRPYQDHQYIIESLTNRMGKSDYEFLPVQVQHLYEMKLKAHEQLKAQELNALQEAQAGFIPSGGYMVACDFYQGDPTNPSKTKRVRVPSESLNWLINKLKTQGSELDELVSNTPGQALQDIGQMMQNSRALAEPAQESASPQPAMGDMNATEGNAA